MPQAQSWMEYGKELRPESQVFCATRRIFWSTTGRALRGNLAPTSIVSDAIFTHPAHRNGYLCVSTASAVG